MDFQNDIFISYSHLDDQPLAEGQKGWITFFHKCLDGFVGQYLGRPPRIWRDPRLGGNDLYSPEIIENLEKAAVLVAVLSPRYVNSEWCIDEVRKFVENTKKQENRNTGNHTRIFKILKFYVPRDRQVPKELQELLDDFKFYEVDSADEVPREIRPEFGTHAQARYMEKVADVAVHIKNVLEMMQYNTAKNQVDINKDKEEQVLSKARVIYLAETTTDLYEQRDKIKRELEQRYTVLPNRTLSLYETDIETVIQGYLRQCDLSVHLIGQRYGPKPDAKDQSIVEIQYNCAKAYEQENVDFSHLAWIPPGLRVREDDRRQQEFVEFLQSDVNFLQTDLEELKTNIHQKLNPLKSSPKLPANSERLRIYIIYDRPDRELIKPVHKYLFDSGFEVLRPDFEEEDETQFRQAHQSYLQLCDAVLICYGNVRERWVRVKLDELQKVVGYGRSQPFMARAVYVTGTCSELKEEFDTHEAQVLKHFEPFAPTALKDFLDQLNPV